MDVEDPRPSELLMAVRRQFGSGTGVFQAAPKKAAATASYCDSIADWLVGLLPGSNIVQVGWGTFAAASIYIVHAEEVPIKGDKKAVGRGAYISAWLACAVGDRLIDRAGSADAQPDGGAFKPGPQLIEVRSLTRDAVESMVGPISSSQARDGFCERTRMTLLSQAPGLDQVLTGWAVMVTSGQLTQDAPRLVPQPSGLAGAFQGRRKKAERTGLVYGATVLGMIGDYLSRDHPVGS